MNCRQAASKGGPQYKGFFDCLVTIAKTEGETHAVVMLQWCCVPISAAML